MVQALAGAPREQKLALIRAHPDLAGRLAPPDLTAASRAEQSGAGLGELDEAERARFLELNERYRGRFGFPFILAVKGRTKEEILAAFEERLAHEPEREFDTALSEIETIALLRLKDRLA